MTEVEKSFTFLQDNIPQWLQDVDGIVQKVTSMQEDVRKINVSESPFAKRRPDSVESIRPHKLNAIVEEPTTSDGVQTDQIGNRKRKTHSVLSGRASGPSRYRMRTMVVVSYDGDMQKSFELLVRATANGRNLLRKARAEAKLAELAVLAGGSSDEEEEDTEQGLMSPDSGYRSRMSTMRTRFAARKKAGAATGGATVPVALLDSTDKSLEVAQSLCEKAAHLTLREGDCRRELEGVSKHLKEVLDVAKSEVTKYHAARPQETQEPQLQDASDTSVSSLESYKRRLSPSTLPIPERELQSEMSLPSTKPTEVTFSPPKIVDMEVDENDDDDENFVMPPVRLTSRFETRG